MVFDALKPGIEHVQGGLRMMNEMVTADVMKAEMTAVVEGGEAIEVLWWQKEYEKLKYLEVATGVRYEHRVVKLVVFVMTALVISVIVWRGLCSWVSWLYLNNLIYLGQASIYDLPVLLQAKKLVWAFELCQKIPGTMVTIVAAMCFMTMFGMVDIDAPRGVRWKLLMAGENVLGWLTVMMSMVGALVTRRMAEWMIIGVIVGTSVLLSVGLQELKKLVF